MSRTAICHTAREAVAGIADRATILVGGFGMAGMPTTLIDALIEQGATDLTIVSNNAGNGDTGLAALLAAGRVTKVICSFPRQSDSYVFDGLYRAGKVQLEVVPQGNLAERIRAAGAAPAGGGGEAGARAGVRGGRAVGVHRRAGGIDLPGRSRPSSKLDGYTYEEHYGSSAGLQTGRSRLTAGTRRRPFRGRATGNRVSRFFQDRGEERAKSQRDASTKNWR